MAAGVSREGSREVGGLGSKPWEVEVDGDDQRPAAVGDEIDVFGRSEEWGGGRKVAIRRRRGGEMPHGADTGRPSGTGAATVEGRRAREAVARGRPAFGDEGGRSCRCWRAATVEGHRATEAVAAVEGRIGTRRPMVHGSRWGRRRGISGMVEKPEMQEKTVGVVVSGGRRRTGSRRRRWGIRLNGVGVWWCGVEGEGRRACRAWKLGKGFETAVRDRRGGGEDTDRERRRRGKLGLLVGRWVSMVRVKNR